MYDNPDASLYILYHGYLESTNARERDRKHEALPDLMHPWFLSPPLLSYLLDYNSSLRACPVRQDLDRS